MGLNFAISGIKDVDRQHIIYVGKHGNDSHDGLTHNKAKLTFGAAITYVNTQTPSTSNRFMIFCDDAGDYTENLTIPSWIGVFASGARIIGNQIVNDNSALHAFRLVASTGHAVIKSSGTGSAVVNVYRIILTSDANGVACSSGIITYQGESIQVENGFGIGNNSTDGIIYSKVNHIDITGSGNGLLVSSSGKVRHVGTSVTCSGGGTCLRIAQTGDIDAIISIVDCNVAYNVVDSGATLHLITSYLSGTQTNNGTANFMSVNNGIDITGNASYSGYTKLGSDAPAIKAKKLTGTTAATEGGTTDIAHGLTGSKILSVSARIEYTAGSYINVEHSQDSGYVSSKRWDGTNIKIYNEATDSENILSKPIVALVTYEE